MTVNPNPNPNLSSSDTDNTICAGTSVTFTAAPAGQSNYEFFLDGLSVQTGTSATYATSTLSNGQAVRVRVTNSSSCSVTSSAITTTVNPNPVVSLTSNDSDNIICAGTGVTFTATPLGAATYNFRVNGSSVQNTSSNTYTSTTLTNGQTVDVIVTLSTGCMATSSPAISMTVNPNPAPVITGTPVVCANQSAVVYQVTNLAGRTYDWLVTGGTITSATGTSSIMVTWGSGTSGLVQLKETVSSTGCSAMAANYSVSINPNPVVTTIPNQIACNGATVSAINLSANTGGGETFNWSGGSVLGLADGSDNSAPFSIPSFTMINTGSSPVSVLVNVSATKAGCTGPLQSFTLTANPSPTFTIVNTTASVCEGTAANITLNSPTTNATITLVNVAYAGATGGTYTGGETFTSGQRINETLGNPTESPIIVRYTFRVAANGCNNLTTQQTTVTINPAPPVFSIANTTAAICTGTATNITLNTPTLNALVRLDAVNYGSATGSPLAIGSTYTTGQFIAQTLTNTTNAPTTVTYTFSVSANGCSNPVTQQTTVVVNPSPTFTIVNTTASVCEGTAANITLNSPTANATITLVNVAYAGATGGTYTGGETFTSGQRINETLGNPTESPIIVRYTFRVAANGCNNLTTQQTTVTINPAPPVFSIANTTAAICTGTATNITLNTPTLNALVRLDAVNYGSATGSPLAIGSTYTTGQFIAQTLTNTTNAPTTVTYTFSVSANGCSNPVTQQTTVQVNPAPAMSIINATSSICSGSAVGITLNSSTTAALIRLISVDYNGATGTLTAPRSYTPGSIITESLTNPTHNIITVTYTFDVSANGCSTAGPFSTTVDVKPSPVFSITNVTPQVCEGTATNITLNTPTFAGRVRLDAVNYNGATGTLSPGQLFTNGQKITETLVNPTNFPITVTYTFSASATSCNNPTQQSTTVTITRPPTVTVPGDYTVCEPVTIPLTGTIGASAVSGLWSVVSGGGTLSATNVSGTTVTANYTVATTDVGNIVTLRLTTNDPDGPTGPCTSVFDDINITINRAARITAGIDLQQCKDQPSIQLQGAITYAPAGVSWSGGTGVFGSVTSPTSTYNFNNPSEINTTRTLTLLANDPDGSGPCTSVSDQMLLRIYPLPTVVFSGLPAVIAENASPAPVLSGNQSGGNFTIMPATSSIPSTTHSPVDRVTFDPSAVEIGLNYITYSFTDVNGCTNSETQQVIVNPVTDIDFTLQYVSGSLAGQYIASNGVGGFDFCGNVGRVRIVGNPEASTGQNPTSFNAVGPNAADLQSRIVQSGSDYFIETDGLPSNNYSLQYTYTNSQGATSQPLVKSIKIFASPVAAIDNSVNNCIQSGIEFKDASTVSNNPFPATLNLWNWDFGDGDVIEGAPGNTIPPNTHAGNTTGNFKDPVHKFQTTGIYSVKLTVTSDQRCSNSTTLVIRVGDVPIVNFNWAAICTNDSTKFQDRTDPGSISTITRYHWNFGDGDVIDGAANDPVPAGTNGGNTTGTYKNPKHKYVSAGTQNVTLSVQTNDNCNNSRAKTISILVSGNTVTPNADNPYQNNFEISNSEWVPEGFETVPDSEVFSNQSWKFGVPTGAVINASAPQNETSSAWWTGNNANSYYPSEESAVNGPCFNLKNLSRPMISLDYWSDAEQNLDGAALQYSTDGGLNWNIVGPATSTPNAGINWYQGQTVQSNPGRQLFGSNGWTGKLTGWRNGRFNLDMIPKAQRDQVRLRIAFSSNNTNDPSKTFDGFAFDNIFIGERKRNVMVEYFTNKGISSASGGPDAYFNNLYNEQFVGLFRKDSSDFFKIEYHIANPSVDPINQANPIDPASRGLFYGISQPPSAIMDGIVGNYYGTVFNGGFLSITREQLERRSLEDPLFNIILSNKPSETDSVAFTLKVWYNHPTLAFSSPVTVQVGLVEDHVKENIGGPDNLNVLRKFLLGPEGITVNRSWVFNDTLFFTRKMRIDAPIGNNNDSLYLVAFVQDKRLNSRVIHQAVKIKIPRKSGDIITGTDDPILAQIKDLAIYPNPATRYINFATNAELTRDYQYSIIDQRGITLLSGNLNRDLSTPQQVELSNIADGAYIVLIYQGGRRILQRKLAVLKR